MKTARLPLRGLLLAQFFGAFNDNAWKIMVFTLATRGIASAANLEASSQLQATLTLLLFLIPMLIFSIPAGAIADRMSKRSVIIGTKLLEVVLMAGATLSLAVAPLHLTLPYLLLAMMGAQSALFGPAKYGIMPEVLSESDLSRGNGLLEMWSMLAIIIGTGLGPTLLAADKAGKLPHWSWLGPFWLTLLSIIGLIGAFTVPKVAPASKESHGMLQTVKRAWNAAHRDKVLWVAILGNIAYWVAISLLGQNVLVYAKSLVQDLAKGELLQGVPPAAYGVGIAIGAFLAGRLSQGRIEFGLIPLGAIGFASTSLMLGMIEPGMGGTVFILILMGITSGLLIVPLHATVQWRAPKEQRGAIIALSNIFDVTGMIAGSLIAVGMSLAGLGMKTMLILSSTFVFACTAWAIRTLPSALVRLVFVILANTLYRIKVRGDERVPKKGAALLVSNHMSLADAFLIMSTVDRPIRFIMSARYYNRWWIKPFASLLHCIPVPTGNDPRATLQALRTAGDALDKGHLVCIFPEGQVTHTGLMQPFRRGIEVIMKGRKSPIIPINLDRLWGSIFSYESEKFGTKWPQKVPYPVTVSFGEPLPGDSTVTEIRDAIKELQYGSWMERKATRLPLHHTFIRQVRRAPWRTVLVDAISGKRSAIKTLTSAIALARALKKSWKDQPNIGILLPPSVPGAIVNLAATLAGRAVVNINYTSGAAGIASAIKQAELKTIITSRYFLEKICITLPDDITIIYAEDIATQISPLQKISALLLSLFSPYKMVDKACGATQRASLDSRLTTIFTSGSTGEPKGVVLSHFNVDSNLEAMSQVIHAEAGKDKVLAVLPFFHSFGYMTLWLGLNCSYTAVLHPNPLDAANIGALVKEHGPTLMLATPTFLKIYYKRIAPGDLGSVKCLITGGEKLPQNLSDAFREKFGLRPIEGFGTTECSPVVATNTPCIRDRGIYQKGTVIGSVGQPLPGVVAKVVDPDTFEPLPSDTEGMLLVKGPNVMQGYLNREDLTQQVMHGDWYITGDIALINSDGFICITDRLSRFSKIGGEMVPHGRVEEELHDITNADTQLFAVTGIPDPKKGEKLVVVHTYDEKEIPTLQKKLNERGLPNLYIPRPDHYIRVDALPTLGTGKLDLRELKRIALEKK